MNDDVTIHAPSSIADLKPAVALKGKVKRVELYGAFVDLGVGQDGLLHISQLGKPNVRNVEDVVKVGEEITVYVVKVDKAAGRITLSLVKPPAVNWDEIKEGDSLVGTIVRIENFGVFVDIGAERPGMVHVSELAEGFVKNPSDVVSVGQEVNVRVIKVNRKKRQIDLSMKQPKETYDVSALDEEEEDLPTAMALAFRRAMQQDSTETHEDRKVSRNSKTAKHIREQEDIIARTLRHHSSR